MSNYARADAQTQWYQDNYPGATMNLTKDTMVVTLHSTEGYDWPTYDGGAIAPNYTGKPPIGTGLLGKGHWRAHFPDEKSSRALQNLAGGVETNTLNDVQLELIGTCDPTHAKTWNGRIAGVNYVFWPNASRRQLLFVARILADFHIRHGLQLVAPRPFKPYPSSYGSNGVRMTFDQWRNAVGVVGHQHIPENVHGDPGNIDIATILDLAKTRVEKILNQRK